MVNNIPDGIPEDTAAHIREAIFDVPDTTGLTEVQKIMIYDLYAKASRSVFYLWVGAMGICLALMVFIKDKGLVRNEDKPVEVGASMQMSGDESVSPQPRQEDEHTVIQEKKANQGDKIEARV